eukprot:TRINITY_DN63270_c0_g1_i1.p1 TRINITY_DN63270_c0_g1~~TRINITY_DN63270_c0_g1_i1.p1  ORF type:complete len:502 (+),score=81.72 TRINITY_DN63270_c0_g1_i1:57-1562(+)
MVMAVAAGVANAATASLGVTAHDASAHLAMNSVGTLGVKTRSASSRSALKRKVASASSAFANSPTNVNGVVPPRPHGRGPVGAPLLLPFRRRPRNPPTKIRDVTPDAHLDGIVPRVEQSQPAFKRLRRPLSARKPDKSREKCGGAGTVVNPRVKSGTIDCGRGEDAALLRIHAGQKKTIPCDGAAARKQQLGHLGADIRFAGPRSGRGTAAVDIKWMSQDVQMHARVIAPALCSAEGEHVQTQFSDFLEFVDEADWKQIANWIVRVHARYRLGPLSLHLALRLLARFMAKQLVPWQEHALLGATALLVASKFEDEIYPDINGLVKLGMGRFSSKELQGMEARFLNMVDFDLHIPTPGHHLPWFHVLSGGDDLQVALSEYITEIGLVRKAAARWTPSLHAGAAAILGAALLKRPATQVIAFLCDSAAQIGAKSSLLGATTADKKFATDWSRSVGDALDAALLELKRAVREAVPEDAVVKKFAKNEQHCVSLRAAQLLDELGC